MPNPYGDTEVSTGNPYGDTEVDQETPGIGEALGDAFLNTVYDVTGGLVGTRSKYEDEKRGGVPRAPAEFVLGGPAARGTATALYKSPLGGVVRGAATGSKSKGSLVKDVGTGLETVGQGVGRALTFRPSGLLQVGEGINRSLRGIFIHPPIRGGKWTVSKIKAQIAKHAPKADPAKVDDVAKDLFVKLNATGKQRGKLNTAFDAAFGALAVEHSPEGFQQGGFIKGYQAGKPGEYQYILPDASVLNPGERPTPLPAAPDYNAQLAQLAKEGGKELTGLADAERLKKAVEEGDAEDIAKYTALLGLSAFPLFRGGRAAKKGRKIAKKIKKVKKARDTRKAAEAAKAAEQATYLKRVEAAGKARGAKAEQRARKIQEERRKAQELAFYEHRKAIDAWHKSPQGQSYARDTRAWHNAPGNRKPPLPRRGDYNYPGSKPYETSRERRFNKGTPKVKGFLQ